MMFYLPVYYLSAAFFIFVWAIGFVYAISKCVEVLGVHLQMDVTSSDLRKWCFFFLFDLLLSIIVFKWIVLSGGPRIAVYRILSSGGSRLVAYPVFIFSMILTAVGSWRFALVLFRSLRSAFRSL